MPCRRVSGALIFPQRHLEFGGPCSARRRLPPALFQDQEQVIQEKRLLIYLTALREERKQARLS